MLRICLGLALIGTLCASMIGCGCGEGDKQGLTDEQIKKARDRVKAAENQRP